MKLRAQFVLEMDAQDYVAAADYQRRMELLAQALQSEFGRVDFSLRERREAAKPGAPRPKPKRTLSTGNLHNYDA